MGKEARWAMLDATIEMLKRGNCVTQDVLTTTIDLLEESRGLESIIEQYESDSKHYVRLPEGADGETIKVNDCVVRDEDPEVYVVKGLEYVDCGWSISIRTHHQGGFYWAQVKDPKELRHVNDARKALMEFAEAVQGMTDEHDLDYLIEEYAERLTVKGEADGQD